jgi:cyclopropane fatty-acyl-phospholipid synthase-like methyltransferase
LHQLARFHAVHKALQDVPVRTLLDVGCGYGDFFYYYVTRNFMLSRYSAVDLNPDFISETKERMVADGFGGVLGNLKDSSMLDYLSAPTVTQHDAVVCISAFSSFADDGLDKLKQSIEAMFDNCIHATVFTVLTKKRPSSVELSIPLDWLIPVMEEFTERIYVDRCTLPHAAVCGMYK